MAVLSVTLLGGYRATYGGQLLANFRSSKVQALFVFLLAEAAFKQERALHRREALMALLWPEKDRVSAQNNLRQTLYYLRQALASAAVSDDRALLLSDRQTVRVNPDACYDLDVAAFLGNVREVRKHRHEDPALCPVCCQHLQTAIDLYIGDFLQDFNLPASPPFQEWVLLKQESLRRQMLESARLLAAAFLEKGQHRRVQTLARRQLEIDPLQEPAHRQLMAALARDGKRAAALRQYETCVQILKEALDVAPAAATRKLYEAIVGGELTLTTGTVYRRRAPEAEVSSSAQRLRRQRLPHHAYHFIGREQELATITGMLEDRECRLLTLSGAGGAGKTRLALEAAHRVVARYRHGAAFVELAAVSDPASIPTAIATALNMRLEDRHNPRTQILHYLAGKEILLVLDNFEHVLDGATLLVRMLETAPRLTLLVTSRVRLNVGAECLFAVGGLSVPEGDEEEAYAVSEAVTLFLATARRLRPDFQATGTDRVAIVRICRLVAGNPLAVELAASAMRSLPPPTIARELAADLDILSNRRRDLPTRLHSMRATFDYSWKLLPEQARDVLMQLAIFRDGAGKHAVETVTGASPSTLSTLVDSSLLHFDSTSGRYTLHPLTRHYTRERLQNKNSPAVASVRDAHCNYYLQMLATRLPQLKGGSQREAAFAVEADFANLRVSWKWAVEHARWRLLAGATEALYLFALSRSRRRDVLVLLEIARQALVGASGARAKRALVYVGAAHERTRAAFHRTPDAPENLQELIALAEEIGDPAAVAYCQLFLGWALAQAGRPSDASDALQAAATYYETARDPFYAARAFFFLAPIYDDNDMETAIDFSRRGLALAREAGDCFVTADLLHNLGSQLHAAGGSVAEAEAYFQEAVDLWRELGASASPAFTLINLAMLALYRGDVEKGQPLLDEAQAIVAEYGHIFARSYLFNALAHYRILAADYEAALALTEEALPVNHAGMESEICFGRAMAYLHLGDVDKAIPWLDHFLSWMLGNRAGAERFLPFHLPYLGVVLAFQGKYVIAAELFGCAAAHARPDTRGDLLTTDPLLRRLRQELKEALSEETLRHAWQRGAARDPFAVCRDGLKQMDQASADAVADLRLLAP